MPLMVRGGSPSSMDCVSAAGAPLAALRKVLQHDTDLAVRDPDGRLTPRSLGSGDVTPR
jgi:hypothetical protein